MIEVLFEGIKSNLWIVGISLFMLIDGTIVAYRKFGLKRVLLGKKNDDRELIYRKQDDSIEWKETIKTWKLILTGGMSILTIFLIIMLLILSFIYAIDIKSTRANDELLCQKFGTVNPTQEQLEIFYGRAEKNLSNIQIRNVSIKR